MNIEKYKHKLNKLSTTLEHFDANVADTNYQTLATMFQEVKNSKVLDITHLDKKEQDLFKLELFITLTKHSGTLAFLVIQNLAAHNIMGRNNYSKKELYFQRKCGIAINHLRAPITIIDSIKIEGGYLLNGTLTWASGYKIFDTLVIGFHHVNEEKEAICNFEPREGFIIRRTEETFVGFGMNTVNITLNNYFVKDEEIISTHQKGNYTRNKSASKTVHFCIYGLGVNALEHIQDTEVVMHSKQKLLDIKEKFIISTDIDELDALRIELFNFVLESVKTGMILNGGSSILSEKSLQRIYRELIMFNSNGLNNTLKSIFKENFLRG